LLNFNFKPIKYALKFRVDRNRNLKWDQKKDNDPNKEGDEHNEQPLFSTFIH